MRSVSAVDEERDLAKDTEKSKGCAASKWTKQIEIQTNQPRSSGTGIRDDANPGEFLTVAELPGEVPGEGGLITKIK